VGKAPTVATVGALVAAIGAVVGVRAAGEQAALSKRTAIKSVR